jgi:hypothetical protein
MNIKLVNAIKKLQTQYSTQEFFDAMNYISEQTIWDEMDDKQREQFFRDECKKLGLTVLDKQSTLVIKEFEIVQNTLNPYFMFWRSRNSDEGRAGIEFGHYHMNPKMYKQYPATEYCFGGPKQQRAMMKRYADELNSK